MKVERGGRVLRVSDVVYRAMLFGYPSEFRRRFGYQMEQVFRTASRETLIGAGTSALIVLWSKTAADLIATATRERLIQIRTLTIAVAGCAVILACLTGVIHARADADNLAAGIVVCGAFACGAMRPSRSWRWSLIIGAGIPIALLVGPHAVAAPASHDSDTPSLLPIVPALIAGYVGARAGLLTPRSRLHGPALPPGQQS